MAKKEQIEPDDESLEYVERECPSAPERREVSPRSGGHVDAINKSGVYRGTRTDAGRPKHRSINTRAQPENAGAEAPVARGLNVLVCDPNGEAICGRELFKEFEYELARTGLMGLKLE
jgi:hypothetical protein